MADVEHRPLANRYVLLDEDAEIGEEQYVDHEGDRVLFHTAVSPDYAGQGLASVLVRGAVDDAIASGLGIVPVCPYVKAWLPKHPEYAEHVVEPAPAHLRAVAQHTRQNAGG